MRHHPATTGISELKELYEKYNKRGIPTNRYIQFEHASIFIRICPMRIDGARYPRPFIQVANISMVKNHQSRGCFTRFYRTAMLELRLPIFVELVSNKRFANGLRKHGFIQLLSNTFDTLADELAPSFYKLEL